MRKLRRKYDEGRREGCRGETWNQPSSRFKRQNWFEERLILPPSAHRSSCSSHSTCCRALHPALFSEHRGGDTGGRRRKLSHFRAMRYYLHTEQSFPWACMDFAIRYLEAVTPSLVQTHLTVGKSDPFIHPPVHPSLPNYPHAHLLIHVTIQPPMQPPRHYPPIHLPVHPSTFWTLTA